MGRRVVGFFAYTRVGLFTAVEEVSRLIDALRAAEHEKSARLQRIVEELERATLILGAEVDQQVATADRGRAGRRAGPRRRLCFAKMHTSRIDLFTW